LPLPKSLRVRVPDRVRDDPRLRAVALTARLIPPRTMHSAAEAAVLGRLAAASRRVVEIGVYEGSSAIVLVQACSCAGCEVHLIDPFVDESGWALRPGFGALPFATRRTVARAVAEGGAPEVVWHVARSQDVGRAWTGAPVDFVFIDGDHSPAGCREDWDVWQEHVGSRGFVAFHDARLGQPSGYGSPGPSSVVDELFRAPGGVAGWSICEEIDSLVVVQRG
jgi:predicted O-methyltransferase YrrM